jgi:hypothetical protein
MMNQSISECEQSINDLDNASLENFAAVGADVGEVKQQIDDLQVPRKVQATVTVTGRAV